MKSEIDIWWAGWLFHHQRQIETVRLVCDAAEKVLQEARKVYGLSTRQGPVALTTLDKAQAARIAEQEKIIRAASNFGEGMLTFTEGRGGILFLWLNCSCKPWIDGPLCSLRWEVFTVQKGLSLQEASNRGDVLS